MIISKKKYEAAIRKEVDPFDTLNGTPAMTHDEFVRFARNRMKTDPRYRKGGSRYNERG